MENQNFVLKLDKLQLKNFRDLEDFEITFDDQLTVLIGENGGGKTSVLDAIAGCLRYLVGEIRQFKDTERFSTRDITVGTDALEICLGFKDTLSPFQLVAHYAKNAQNADYHSTGVQTEISQNQEPRPWRLETRLRRFYDSKDEALPLIAYYPSPQGTILNLKPIKDDFLYKFNTYENALDEQVIHLKVLKKWLIHQSNLSIYDREEEDSHLFETVREALVGENGILNGEEERPFTHFRVSFKGIHGDEGNFLLTKNGKPIFDYQLSSGERMLMLLVSDLARRAALATRSQNPLQEVTGVVLIDEIDLHLHPKWQRKVLPRLRFLFPKIQFIVATHSPFVIASVQPNNVYMMTEDKTTHKKRVGNAQLEEKHTKG